VDLFLFIVRAILAALFTTAGFAKLADLKGAEKAARGFGVHGGLSKFGPVALSIVEIALAAMLLFPTLSWYGAIGAALLLLVFIVMMTYQWANGNAPDCHCFGQLHSEPVGLKSIVRNGVFLALVGVVLYSGRPHQGLEIDQITAEMVPTILGTLAVLMLGGSLLYLRNIVASQDELRRRLDVLELVAREGAPVAHEHLSDPHEGLPIGAPLPAFRLKRLDGASLLSRDLLADGKGVLFFFVSPTCEPCQILLPEFRNWSEDLKDRTTTVFISSGDAKENRKKFSELGDLTVLLDDGRAFAVAAGGRWTPTALYVDPKGRIASHVAAGDIAVAELVDKIKASDLGEPFTFFSNGHHQGRGLNIGLETPDFTLVDIEGREITRQDLLGKRTLFTFWSTTCPYCTQLLDEFKKWETSRTNGHPNVILISDGDVEEHKQLGFSSPVILDKDYRTAAKLGMLGTPSAVLVNEDGVIESETAVGAKNIWALLGRNDEAD